MELVYVGSISRSEKWSTKIEKQINEGGSF